MISVLSHSKEEKESMDADMRHTETGHLGTAVERKRLADGRKQLSWIQMETFWSGIENGSAAGRCNARLEPVRVSPVALRLLDDEVVAVSVCGNVLRQGVIDGEQVLLMPKCKCAVWLMKRQIPFFGRDREEELSRGSDDEVEVGESQYWWDVVATISF